VNETNNLHTFDLGARLGADSQLERRQELTGVAQSTVSCPSDNRP
jgi:hypothetical protein